MTDIAEVMAKLRLDKKTAERIRAASEIELKRIETPSLKLTAALGGGIPLGRQTLIWGNKSAGKTSFTLQLIAEAQRQGMSCAFIDVEGTFDSAWATRLGVDTDKLMVIDVKTTNDAVNVGKEMMTAGLDILVVDSISALIPGSYFDKEDELKQLDGTKQIGSEARDMANAMRMLNYANQKTTLILISQERNQISSYGAVPKPTGGKAVEFYSTTSIRFVASASDKNQIKSKVRHGDVLVEVPVGRPVDWTVSFNKAGPPSKTGTYDFYYDGDVIGVDQVGELVDLGKEYGVLSNTGAWWTVDGERIQGRANVIAKFREEKELFERIRGEINAATSR